ncbi:hypothetical protein [Desulfosporosinus sp. BICA1-9]|uniref:hypothetical protein n=1 Tax=Desulfosporosinus sp. BICA1-9 TaxID=1531958 RepID=UPI000B243EBD|nr:hypothetical protein [Desulfosporosinus sp. BICA1-9]
MKEVNGIEIDEQKAKRILRKIILMETENRARQTSPTEMAKKIKKLIEEEVQCY